MVTPLQFTNIDKLPRKVKLAELQPGDIVQLNDTGPFLCGVVEQVSANGNVSIFRPFATSSDFSFSDGKVIPYIGIETIEYFEYDKSTTMTLWQRKNPK